MFIISNADRKIARRIRRDEKRSAIIAERNLSFAEVFTYENLYVGFKRSANGVRWKASTQQYQMNAAMNILDTLNALHRGDWKTLGFHHFTIYERGKLRQIRSVHISERVVQHTLCDNLLTPMLNPSLIYDNSGSLPLKGMDFAIRRVRKHLGDAIRKHGKDNVYILVYDFKSYFDSVDHDEAMNIISRYVIDPKCRKLIRQLIDDFGDVGIGLGSQISQAIAAAIPNRIDHYMKEVGQIKGYGRYMDDGYAIHNDKEHLENLLEDLKKLCEELNITLNTKKSRIVHLSEGFTFLKMRFTTNKNGKIIQKVVPKTIKRQRRKLKKLFGLYRNGEIDLEGIDQTMNSFMAHLKRGNAHNAKCNLQRLYYDEYAKLKADGYDISISRKYDHELEKIKWHTKK